MSDRPKHAWPPIARHVWETKYRWDAEPDIEHSWRRVARAVASVEKENSQRWGDAFEDILREFAFLPGGRILAGAGTGRRRVTLLNCFVMGLIDDTLEGIFDALKEGAMTMQSGGGIGYDFSTLRPRGRVAATSGSIASGPVSFMKIWDSMCATMLSTGARRGAMMATLRCDHPDIEEFVEVKRDPRELRHFNLSVQVTDEFMTALRADADWPLVFPAGEATRRSPSRLVRREWPGFPGGVDCEVVRTVPARTLWDRILRSAYASAEPGLLFIDRINCENNLGYRERISATNPCGELPLPPYGACNLGSLNLPAFVIEPFQPGARLDFARLESVTRTAIRFLDDVIDLSYFPSEPQSREAHAARRVGLGITGLGDALAMLGQRYDGWTGRGVAEEIVQKICLAAYGASVELARERGAFPRFERDAFLGRPFVARLPALIRDSIARHGIRNSHLVAIAPAGTISILAGNVSSGMEPIFALESERQILDADGRYRSHVVGDYAWELWRASHPGVAPPEALLVAYDVAARDQLAMQAALQKWVDNAISKTINVPAETPYADFAGVYELAYDLGLKGCTVFRPSGQRGSVLRPAAQEEPAHCCDLDREAD